MIILARHWRYAWPLLLALAAVAFAEPRLSVRDLMVSAVTPATNTLWGVGDPQTYEDWQALEDAAVVVIATTTLIAEGGTGPSDDEWAADPAWQGYVATLRDAAEAARAAVKARDLDALLQANDDIYPPCEECHQAFHPGFQ